MAVIITNMDMPKNCMDCRFGYFYREGGANGIKCCLTQENSFGESKEEDSNFRFYCCPLKPVDGLIDKLADMADSDAYGDYQLGTNFGLMLAAKIVKEYCEE